MKKHLYTVGELLLGILLIFTVTLVTTGIGMSLDDMVSIPCLLEGSQFVGFFVGSIGAIKFFDVPLDIEIPTKEDFKVVGYSLDAVFLIAILLSVVVSFLGISAPENAIIEDLVDASPIVLFSFVILNILFVGPAEEFVFRGYVQRQIGKTSSVKWSIILSASIFSVVHVPAMSSGEPASMGMYLIVLALMGGILGGAYERTDNIIVPILIHAAYNSLLTVQFLL
jgi:membrane protease YdiL (CAAX protease family)